jgi:hypothetical protein
MVEQQGLLGDDLRARRRPARPPLSDERDGRRLAGFDEPKLPVLPA